MTASFDKIMEQLPVVGPKPPKVETPPTSEPAPEVPQGAAANGADSSPSAVASAEAALILRHTHLMEQYPKAKLAEEAALAERRAMGAEMVEIERLLRAHKRLREPVRRKR